VQQGVEFILKGKVVEVSPYLLLAGPPDRWPSPYEAVEPSFSQFKTVDAQDLVRLHDTVQNNPLPPPFVRQFNDLRVKRNAISHSIDKRLEIHTIEVILCFHKTLFPAGNWLKTRVGFIDNYPRAKLDGGDFSTNLIARELDVVLNLLPPASVKDYFGIDKKQRRYLCATCWWNANHDVDFDNKLAVLRPKSPASTRIYCRICDSEYAVIREDCPVSSCSGNVLSADDDRMCLTCGASNP